MRSKKTEGACVISDFSNSLCSALSLSRLRRQLPPGGSHYAYSFLLKNSVLAQYMGNQGVVCKKGWLSMEKIIYDHQILGIERAKNGILSRSLIFKVNKEIHSVDFEECAENYLEKRQTSNDRCIGERNIEKGFYLLFTDNTKTKILFQKSFLFHSQKRLLHGTKQQRFLQLQKWITQAEYTTFDLT